MKHWQTALVVLATVSASLALYVATGCKAKSPLDAPGEKKVTVRSEIYRGYGEVVSKAIKIMGIKADATHSHTLVALEAELGEVIINNQARQKDSEGFMLGARLATVERIDFALRSDKIKDYANAEEIAAAQKNCRADVAEIRSLQKQLGIDDDALILAIEDPNPARIKALLASYDREM